MSNVSAELKQEEKRSEVIVPQREFNAYDVPSHDKRMLQPSEQMLGQNGEHLKHKQSPGMSWLGSSCTHSW